MENLLNLEAMSNDELSNYINKLEEVRDRSHCSKPMVFQACLDLLYDAKKEMKTRLDNVKREIISGILGLDSPKKYDDNLYGD